MSRQLGGEPAPTKSGLRNSAQPSCAENAASLETLRRSRREAWRAAIFVVVAMFLIMLMLLGGAWYLIHCK